MEEAVLTSCLSFEIDKETYGVNVNKIIEILEVPHITKVPKSPSFMRGVINLRGTVLPVIDTRLKFGVPGVPDSINTCIIVFNMQADGNDVLTGALVDEVKEVFEINESEILPPPGIGGELINGFIRGIIRKGDDFIMVPDIDRIFSNADIIDLNMQLQGAEAKVKTEKLRK